MSKTAFIKETIQAALPDAQVFIVDPYNDGEHFQGIVVSASFEGLPLVKQHQKVMLALKSAFAETVHALALKTFTPEKWESEKQHYPGATQ